MASTVVSTQSPVPLRLPRDAEQQQEPAAPGDDAHGSSDVLFERAETADREPPEAPLGDLLGLNGFGAVDNSGSTAGAPLAIARAFADSLGVREISLWNSHSEAPVPREDVRWVSTGGTRPESIFEPTNRVPTNATGLVFMTDGQVFSTAPLAKHAHVTSHLPSLLVIFATGHAASLPVASLNVSVLMAHFSAARTAAVVVVHSSDGTAALVATKGDWTGSLPQAPELTPELRVQECPLVSISQLSGLPSRVYPHADPGSIPLGGRHFIHLGRLMQIESSSEAVEILQQMTTQNHEDIARAFFSLGTLREWGSRLSHWLSLVAQDERMQVEQDTRDSTNSVHSLLRRIRMAQTQPERGALNAQLHKAMRASAHETDQAARQAGGERRSARRVLNEQLKIVAGLESAGMTAAALGRLSNRAGRAVTVDRAAIAALASLDIDGAPEEEDLIMYDTGPVALCVRAMEDVADNTSDFAIDQALRAGQAERNAVFEPTLVPIADGIADRVESLETSPMTRQPLSVCLPIVSLAGDGNRNAVYQRLCLIFTNGLRMPHVWLVALSSMLRALERHDWAQQETSPTGRLLSFMASQILRHVVLPAGSRLSPGNEPLRVEAALTRFFRTDDATVHSSVIEMSVMLRLLHRFGGAGAVSTDALRQAMQARIATAVPQSHRNWLQRNSSDPWGDQGPCSLAALLSSIFDTRISSTGRHVAIAGTGHEVQSLRGLLMPSDLDAIETFANNVLFDDSADSLIVPGLSVAVLATVMHVTDPCISSTRAVQLARQADLPSIASEMDARTAGATSVDEAIGAIHRHLAWARVPLGILSPFTTPLGPSTLWFYIGDGRVYDMTQGFEVRPGDDESDEGRQAMISRLAEHVRTVRGRLLARFHNTNEYGSMVPGSTTAPIYRAMVDEYRHSAAGHTGLRDPSQAAQFIHRVMGRLVDRRGTSAGNLHMDSMERTSTMLLPSFLHALEAFPASDAASCSEADSSSSLSAPQGPSLALRITLELGNRTPGALGAPLPAVHVPLDNPEADRVLEMVAHEQAAARARALLRHRVAAPANDGGRPAHNSQQPPRSRIPGSRQLSWYLRHQASTRPDGFVAMETLLRDLNAPGLTAEHVLELVEMDPKGRFDVAAEEEGGGLAVRANQGHTVLTVDAEQLMTPIDDPENLPICLHGTYMEALEAIVRSGSLNRMQRCAIQMAAGLPSDPQVRSGIRSNAEVVIYVDVRAAMALGLGFYRSSNGVICCPGPIPVSCFLQVVQMSNGSLVDIKGMQRRLDTGSICIDDGPCHRGH